MTPLSRSLKRDVDPNAIEAGWERIRARRARRRNARYPLAAAALVALAALVFFVIRPRPATPATVLIPVAVAGPLQLANGAALPTILSGPGESVVTFDDGSRAEIAPASSLRTKATDAKRVDLALERGRTTFDIVPGGPRAWSVDAGRVVVRVLGTRFTVERAARSVDVRVERGTVSVEGTDVPGGAKTLVAGESIHVEEQVTPSPPVITPSSLPPVATAPAATQVVAEGDLMTRADAARRDGRPRDAVALLRKVVARRDGEGALAAFTIAKIEAEDLGDPAAAATWFEQAAGLGLPSGLDEEALARAVESYAKANRMSEAARAARRYEARFPNGRHLERVRSWAAL
jgi:transmembrane sensor